MLNTLEWLQGFIENSSGEWEKRPQDDSVLYYECAVNQKNTVDQILCWRSNNISFPRREDYFSSKLEEQNYLLSLPHLRISILEVYRDFQEDVEW